MKTDIFFLFKKYIFYLCKPNIGGRVLYNVWWIWEIPSFFLIFTSCPMLLQPRRTPFLVGHLCGLLSLLICLLCSEDVEISITLVDYGWVAIDLTNQTLSNPWQAPPYYHGTLPCHDCIRGINFLLTIFSHLTGVFQQTLDPEERFLKLINWGRIVCNLTLFSLNDINSRSSSNI